MDPQATYDAWLEAEDDPQVRAALRAAYNSWRDRGGFPARDAAGAEVPRIMPDEVEGQDAARGFLAVNPLVEGSAEWHAWARGYDYAVRTDGVYAEPLSHEWADMLSLPDLLDGVASDLGMDSDLFEAPEEGAICDAFELGYLTYVSGWRV